MSPSISFKVIFRPLQWLYTLYVWVITAVFFMLHYGLSCAIRPFTQDPEWTSLRLTWPFLKTGFWLCGFKFTVEGQENLPQSGSFILISNHQSHLDIVSFILAIPKKFAFVAKKELLNVPILGWDIRDQGHISIDRSDARGAVLELKKLEKMIENGKSVLLFPEGTRTKTGEVGPFKKGAFMIASHTGVPLIPCVIKGTFDILNKHSFHLKPGHIHIKIGPAFLTQKHTDPILAKQQAEALLTQSQAWITTTLQILS